MMQEILDKIAQMKGDDKYQAIKALVTDPNNAPVLLALSQSEWDSCISNPRFYKR